MIAAAVPWVLLLPATALAWVPRWQRAALGLMLGGYLFALVVGQIDALGLVWLGLLSCAFWLTRQPGRRGLAALGHATFVLLAVLLGVHALPGFHNLRVVDAARFTLDALPFTMYLNLDKPFVGFVLLFALGRQWVDVPPMRWLKTGIVMLVATSAVCIGAAMALGGTAWNPKWPAETWLWSANNLLLVTMPEEAFFRGYVQGELMRMFGEQPRSRWIALIVTAALFGAAHFAGGPIFALLAFVAGIGYGIALLYGGLPASVLTHFGLNFLHFVLFTYPMLAR
jgi:membrane protease YdiL (CAAX protease family)